MIISVNNPVWATQIFSVLFIVFLILTVVKKKTARIFSPSLTEELKGFAILTIIFAHIGYFLVTDSRFLFPLSIFGGVGVNLFLFLSGYGLTMSALTKKLTIIQFYQKRLLRLYKPFWLTILIFLGLDFFILSRTYSLTYIGQSLLGFFPQADMNLDLNSPLWYFTLIAFYYILFPLIFLRKKPWLSAGILYLIGYLVIKWDPTFLHDVLRLYRVHILAFPLGILAARLALNYKDSSLKIYLNSFWCKLKQFRVLAKAIYFFLILFLVCLIGYTAYYSHVDDVRWLEELTSLFTCGLLIILFVIKKFEIRLLSWFGLFSYEIYLLHWPILSRFDFFYCFLPAWLATILYLAFFLGLGWLLRYITNRIKL